MFDVGFFELLVIAVVALIALGPDQFPVALRSLGRFMGKIKKSVSEFQDALERAHFADDVKKAKDQLDKLRDLNPPQNKEQGDV